MKKQLNDLNVVMVDDDSDDVFLTKALLKRSHHPFKFMSFNSGASFLNYIGNNGTASIDVVLLDVKMPVETGYDVLKKLRTVISSNDLNVIMFSTFERPSEKKLAMERGANDFIKKPACSETANQFVDLLFTSNFVASQI